MTAYSDKLSSIRWNGMAKLASERDAGTTQAGMERDTIAAAKADGRDISRVAGRRRPTEVYDDATGTWVKVREH